MRKYKRICVYYQMSINHSRPSDDLPHDIETAENCIRIAVLEEIADDVLEKQRDSLYVSSGIIPSGVKAFLTELAILQGYRSVEFIKAEEDYCAW